MDLKYNPESIMLSKYQNVAGGMSAKNKTILLRKGAALVEEKLTRAIYSYQERRDAQMISNLQDNESNDADIGVSLKVLFNVLMYFLMILFFM